jgi:DNA-binding Xre family transcriptional regulator
MFKNKYFCFVDYKLHYRELSVNSILKKIMLSCKLEIEEVIDMALTFEPLRIFFVKKKLDRMELINKVKLSPATASKVWNDRFPVRTDTIDRICEYYDLEVHEVIRRVKKEETHVDD